MDYDASRPARLTRRQLWGAVLDLEHAQHGGVDPNAILREAGRRVTEVDLRNSLVPMFSATPREPCRGRAAPA